MRINRGNKCEHLDQIEKKKQSSQCKKNNANETKLRPKFRYIHCIAVLFTVCVWFFRKLRAVIKLLFAIIFYGFCCSNYLVFLWDRELILSHHRSAHTGPQSPSKKVLWRAFFMKQNMSFWLVGHEFFILFITTPCIYSRV